MIRCIPGKNTSFWPKLSNVIRLPRSSCRKVSPIKMRRARRDEEEMTGTNMKGLTNGNRDLWNMVRPKEFENSDKNEQAERSLLGVRKKLFSPLSVECQVSELINEATDTSNLCRMFPGWQPWL